MLINMRWKEGDGLKKSQYRMTTSLQAYLSSNNSGVGDTTDLHGNLGWLKINESFGDVLDMLRKEHQGDTTRTGRKDGPPDTANTNVTAYFSEAGMDTDLGGREDRRLSKKERKRIERRQRWRFGPEIGPE